MQKYVKYVDETTGLCGEVALGNDAEYFTARGFSLRDVEKAYDGQWYLVGKAPSEPIDNIKTALRNYLLEKKSKVVDGYILLVTGGNEYRFMLDPETSRNRIVEQAIAFMNLDDTATVDWKVYEKNSYTPHTITLTKTQFGGMYAFGKQITNSAFEVESEFNSEIDEMTEAELRDAEHVANFKARAESSYGQISIRYELNATVTE